MVVVALVIFAILLYRPSWRQAVNANAGVASTFLSAMLVLLYFGQHRLLGRQVELENKTVVDIQTYEVDGKKLSVWLSNPGNGVATEIELKSCIEFPQTGSFSPGCESTRFRRVGEEGNYKKNVGNSLEAGEHNVRFIAEPLVDITPSEEGGWGLLAATSQLKSEGIDEAKLNFWVEDTNLLGRKEQENVFGMAQRTEIEPGGINLEGFYVNRKVVAEDWDE